MNHRGGGMVNTRHFALNTSSVLSSRLPLSRAGSTGLRCARNVVNNSAYKYHSSSQHRATIEFTAWATSGFILTLNAIIGRSVNHDALIMTTSILSLVLGLRVFLVHGYRMITANGLFSISLAMFIGVGGIYIVNIPYPSGRPEYVFQAALGGFLMQIAVAWIGWGGRDLHIHFPAHRTYGTHKLSSIFSAVGVFAFAAAIVAYATGISAAIAEATAFTAICATAVGFWWRSSAHAIGLKSGVILGMMATYAVFLHSGQGRLRIVALACTVSIIYSSRFLHLWFKPLVVAIMPAAVLWLATTRLALQETLATGASEGRTGLESMVAPLAVFSQVLEAKDYGLIDSANGRSFLSVLSQIIPASWWPEAPQALGYELVAIVQPLKYDSGFSTVATSAGEAFYNFGWLGIPFISVLVGLVIRGADKFLLRIINCQINTHTTLLWLLITVVLIGSIADYTWSGTHTYVARNSLRFPLIGLFMVVTFMGVHKPTRRR